MTHKLAPDLEAIISQISDLKKYRGIDICEDTIRDLVIAELKRHKRTLDAVKVARKKLHRVVAPYLADPDYDVARKELETAFQSNKPHQVQRFCRNILSSHASTRERLSILDEFYTKIFAVTGKPDTLLDLACGLSPLSFTWMGLPTSTRYHAYDIHQQRVDFLNAYFVRQGLSPRVQVRDILVHPPRVSGDVAFILKEIHRFEQRQRGCTLPLLEALRVHHIVISLPTQNLTGRWDLTDRHRQLFDSVTKGKPWEVNELEFENELVFCVDKS